LAAARGYTEVTKVLVEAGASLSAENSEVIKHSVKLIQSNIKLLTISHQIFTNNTTIYYKSIL
jgi:hypothetical protein